MIAAASNKAKLTLAREHGADVLLDYSDEAIKNELKSFGGIDVVIDPVGGAYSEQALRALRPGGRLLVVGFAGGEIARIPLNLPLLKDCSINGVFLAAQTRDHPEDFVAIMSQLFELYEQGSLRPVLNEFDCFKDYEAAIQQIADRNAVGKVVMRVASGSGQARLKRTTHRTAIEAGSEKSLSSPSESNVVATR